MRRMPTLKYTMIIFALPAVLNSSHCYSARVEDSPEEPAAVLSTLERGHPRLILTNDRLEELKRQHKGDKLLQRYVQDVLERAEGFCGRPVLVYQKRNGKMLHVSRRCLWRVYALAFAWRWTGQEKYAEKAEENLLAVCAFRDWNPAHFLDTAEMSHAVGVGYDWLFDYLDERNKEKIKAGLIKNGMEAGIAAYKGKGPSRGWWVKVEHNWNQVCNSGLLIGALAIAETDSEYAQFIVPHAVTNMPHAIRSYAPDGAWLEGPGYWNYATTYTAYGLSALNTALGKDFGLSKITGFSETGFFPIYALGPTGLFLNFADSGDKASRKPIACMFWLARRFNNSLFADNEHAVLREQTARPEHVIWYVPGSGTEGYPSELDRYFRGPVEVAVFRSAWDDSEALFVGIKGGYNQVNHGHLDLGNFELDALGVRWVRDLGSDNYNLPGYFKEERGGLRWTYYRMRSASHNVPLLGGEDQDPFASASIVKCEVNKPSSFAVVDLTEAYKEFAEKVTRGVRMVDARRAVLVQDEFEIEKPCEVVWGMTTDAEIEVEAGAVARLRLDGRQLVARLLCPVDGRFAVESAEQAPPEKTNTGVKRLVVRLSEVKGNVRLAVLFSPVWEGGEVAKAAELKSLAEW